MSLYRHPHIKFYSTSLTSWTGIIIILQLECTTLLIFPYKIIATALCRTTRLERNSLRDPTRPLWPTHRIWCTTAQQEIVTIVTCGQFVKASEVLILIGGIYGGPSAVQLNLLFRGVPDLFANSSATTKFAAFAYLPSRELNIPGGM